MYRKGDSKGDSRYGGVCVFVPIFRFSQLIVSTMIVDERCKQMNTKLALIPLSPGGQSTSFFVTQFTALYVSAVRLSFYTRKYS